ncbi:MAG: GNAT family N-acetyltransferase [Rhodospirillales bacterium]|jgi:N-acetylglutamate synthase-like GNAT family acetyltransferase|nr:GNAT family N-acetyltransferase [Rhodospirillales bacterium]
MRVRPCIEADFEALYAIINNAAEAYRGIIPADRWKVPYMGRGELSHEIAAGVVFWCCKEKGELIGVMGLQDVEDVTLIRHAYVDTAAQRRGVGGRLLDALLSQSERPFLVGTWAAAAWAIRFYEKHGFRLLSVADKNRLLKRYWAIPERQVETSVVLADDRWRSGTA